MLVPHRPGPPPYRVSAPSQDSGCPPPGVGFITIPCISAVTCRTFSTTGRGLTCLISHNMYVECFRNNRQCFTIQVGLLFRDGKASGQETAVTGKTVCDSHPQKVGAQHDMQGHTGKPGQSGDRGNGGPLLRFPWEGTSEVGSAGLGLPSLKNFSGLSGVGLPTVIWNLTWGDEGGGLAVWSLLWVMRAGG